uniref:Uncharacterized protein n=1 Tax=Poecilia reticulata TaxID=8081 RepID=A0A3P9NVR0_POERE
MRTALKRLAFSRAVSDWLTSSFQRMCRINYVIGDLFTASNHESLAQCVSRDLRMGKGIAVLFKNNFGRTSELKEQKRELWFCKDMKGMSNR